jgi:LPPG:FO 2-phospho-L-lactate transferase
VDANLVDAIVAGGVTARAVPLLMSDAPATEAMAAQALALADELR